MKLKPKKIYKSIAKQLDKHKVEIEIGLAILSAGMAAGFAAPSEGFTDHHAKLVSELEKAHEAIITALECLDELECSA